jgi:acyl-coenzyme A synthetase/AMP-(fatty) acid ligase
VHRIKTHPDVRDAAIVAFADRRSGVGLYAFVEANAATLESELHSAFTSARNGPKPPEHIQIVPALPRDARGLVRTEILQLVAMNQVDLIEPLLTSTADRVFMKSILDQRKNLRDRFSF